jgi:uncharacterized damage-inducible protein DinB
MISTDHCRLMAHYNRWQNTSLCDAASTLTDAERRRDAGAFFGSIHRTFNHLWWGDELWLARFDGEPKPKLAAQVDMNQPGDWQEFLAKRQQLDERIIDWANTLTDAFLGTETSWVMSGTDIEMNRSTWLCVAHLFNHQTHHRGQIHCLLTAAGASPGPTDLPLVEMPFG